MKRLLSLLLLLACVCASLAACSADNGADNKGNATAKPYSQGLAFEVCADDSSQCIITGIGSCTDKDIVIPAYINGMRVRGIADGAFSPKGEAVKGMKAGMGIADATVESLDATPEIHTVKSVSDTEQITDEKDNDSTQNGQPSYSTIDGNGGFTIVGGGEGPGYEFGHLIIDRGEGYVTGDGEPIALEKIESVQIPNTVTSIGEEAFYGCEELGVINAHKQIASIGKDAFLETAYYNDAKNWDGEALYLSTYLISVSLQFNGEFTVREGTTLIADRAFYNCEGVTYVNMAASVYSVGNYAFSGCTSLKYVEFTGEVKYTGVNIYNGCVSYQPVGPGGATSTPDAGADADTDGRYPKVFDVIDEELFERVKENSYDRYVYEKRREDSVEILMRNGSKTYYTYRENGAIEREIFGNESGVYMRLSGDLYATTAEIPEAMWIPEELHFSMLTLFDADRNLYAYVSEEDGISARLEIGFSEGKLSYLGFHTPEGILEIYYYGVDVADAPDAPMDRLVDGVVVDQNGNQIECKA